MGDEETVQPDNDQVETVEESVTTTETTVESDVETTVAPDGEASSAGSEE